MFLVPLFFRGHVIHLCCAPDIYHWFHAHERMQQRPWSNMTSQFLLFSTNKKFKPKGWSFGTKRQTTLAFSFLMCIFLFAFSVRDPAQSNMSSKVNCFKSLLVKVSNYSFWSAKPFSCFVKHFFSFSKSFGVSVHFFSLADLETLWNRMAHQEQRIISSSRYSLCSQLICCRRPDRTAQPYHC